MRKYACILNKFEIRRWIIMRIFKKLKICIRMRTYAFAKVGICRHAAYIYQNSRILGKMSESECTQSNSGHIPPMQKNQKICVNVHYNFVYTQTVTFSRMMYTLVIKSEMGGGWIPILVTACGVSQQKRRQLVFHLPKMFYKWTH